FLPNSFTPSNSSNTVFEIYTQKEKVELVVFEIFDRWGEKIFETKDIYEGWDGTSKGKLCNSDVFAYKVLYKTRYTQDQVFEKTGLVSLIR
ncbi:MAG: gliding motility-associated C-terminal domain-containing protein, partial [Bacteroidales bacterium]|nr:gliding motility-associated C-terminal domain-containing protein [Bacteroidales bacterium]